MDNLALALGQNMKWLLLLAVFLATVFAVLGTVAGAYTLLNPQRRRLAQLATGDSPTLNPSTDGEFRLRVLEPMARPLMPEEDWQKSHLRRRLVRAGLRAPDTMSWYLAAKVALGLGLPLIAFIVLLLSGLLALRLGLSMGLLALLALLGFFAPNIYLLHRIQSRQQAIAEGFPDGLDMLVVCIEAGLSLDAAIQRVAKELRFAHPALAEEFELLSLEMRAGQSRDEALRNLAERTGVDDIQMVTSILIQAQHFGTSIGSSLREQADDLRLIRMQRAREKAGKLPVKLIMPIVAFIFPAIFLIILGPACIRIFTAIISRAP